MTPDDDFFMDEKEYAEYQIKFKKWVANGMCSFCGMFVNRDGHADWCKKAKQKSATRNLWQNQSGQLLLYQQLQILLIEAIQLPYQLGSLTKEQGKNRKFLEFL